MGVRYGGRLLFVAPDVWLSRLWQLSSGLGDVLKAGDYGVEQKPIAGQLTFVRTLLCSRNLRPQVHAVCGENFQHKLAFARRDLYQHGSPPAEILTPFRDDWCVAESQSVLN